MRGLVSGLLGRPARPAPGQLLPLVALRWRMVRSPRSRAGLALLAALVPVLCSAAVVAGISVDREQLAFDIHLLAPSIFLGFAALTVLAPVATGTGSELFPADQLVGYPITPRTQFRVSLLLAPLNLAWIIQLVLLSGVTAILAGPTPRVLLALIVTYAYILLLTALGQALAWLVEGVRQTRRGRRAGWAAAGGILMAALVAAETVGLTTMLDRRAPTRPLVVSIIQIATGSVSAFVVGVAALAGLTLALVWLGARACDWTGRRLGDAGAQRESRALLRREPRREPLFELLAVDRASVWRSAPLRRGGVVVALMPSAVAAVASLDWSSLVLIPALVAAGAGLLFGVNVFCLDSSGALWLASLPHPPRLAFTAKTLVLGEFCALSVALAVLAGALSADRRPTLTEVTALTGSAVVCLLTVVTICMRMSIARPHHAELRTRRDAPAPPGAMIIYSVRLAVSTTLVALVFSLLALLPWWWLPALFAIPLSVRCVLGLIDASRQWDDDRRRAVVVATVSAG
jgi:hypothetical protein